MDTQIDPLRGASNFRDHVQQDTFRCKSKRTLLYDSSKTIPLETENDLLLGSHKTCFFSYDQRVRKTVLKVAIERDLSLKQIITKRK